MGWFQRRNRPPRRFRRHSVKRRRLVDLHPKRTAAIVLSVIAVIIIALVWGSVLNARSEKYRADKEAGLWTLDRETARPHPVIIPDMRAMMIKPEGNVGDILIAGNHEGILLPLISQDGTVNYRSNVAEAAGMTTAPDAPILAEDVERVSRRGLRVTLVYSLTYAQESDPAVRQYRRGVDLALLREFAEGGADDILLLGLPAGDDRSDRESMAFIADLTSLLQAVQHPPAIGAALDPMAFYGGTDEEDRPLYAGNSSPMRFLSVCTYLALDLRAYDTEEAVSLMEQMQYAYVRYSLRLLVDREDGETVDELLSRGLDRIFEMESLPQPPSNEGKSEGS